MPTRSGSTATRVRPTPRISVNKLGEYLTATPARRRQIVKEQKYPPTYQVIRYNDAEEAIAEFLLGNRDPSILDRHVKTLRRATPSSDYDAQRIELCIDAIESFRELAPDLSLPGLRIKRSASDASQLRIGGVNVSVRPEVILGSASDEEGRTGLIKLYLSKSYSLDERSGLYVAAVARRYAEKYLDGAVDPDLVLVVDVFAQAVFSAPKAVKRRFADVEAACEEISARWSTV